MKFRYLIVDEWDAVWGTDSLKAAKDASEENGALVIDVKTSEILSGREDREAIDAYEPPEDPNDEEDES